MRMDKWIEKMFQNAFKKEYFETYWAFDVHGVIFRPNHRKDDLHADWYPYAKRTLQILSVRDDIVLILATSSYPDEIEFYQKIFKENNIHFKYVNENPDIDSLKGNFGDYSQKYYFNVMFEDKSGFDPETEWEPVHKLMLNYELNNIKPDNQWTTKF